jgi:uncharacterized SAM-binding protein YcdF (DUF218 family)
MDKSRGAAAPDMRCDNAVIVARPPRQVSVLRRWFLRGSLLAAAALIISALAGWKTVLRELGEFLVSAQTPQPAGLILVLAGDFYGPRVLQGAELGVHGYAPVVLISSEPYGWRTEGIVAIDFLAERGYPRQLFQRFEHHAPSTITEAIALRPELKRRGVKRVLLVTSAYHSRRASIVFRLFCPGIQFITIGAPDKHYHPDDWWEDPSSRRLFFVEWGKILGTVFYEYPKYALESILPRSGD